MGRDLDGVSCKDNNHAEILATLALLMKCEELKFDKVKLWSDSARAIGCINGSEASQMDDKNLSYILVVALNAQKVHEASCCP